jgi:hypothetical protein
VTETGFNRIREGCIGTRNPKRSQISDLKFQRMRKRKRKRKKRGSWRVVHELTQRPTTEPWQAAKALAGRRMNTDFERKIGDGNEEKVSKESWQKDGDLNLTTKAQRWILNKLAIEAPRAGFVGFARWLLGPSLGQVPPAPGRSPAPTPGERAASFLFFNFDFGLEEGNR